MTNEETLAYLAGIIDGEGSIGIKRMKPTAKNPTGQWIGYIGAGMTDEQPIRMLQAAFGGCVTIRPPKRVGWRKSWKWQLTSQKACAAISRLFPFLQIKNRQGRLCVELHETKHKPGRLYHLCLTQAELDRRHQLWIDCCSLK